MVPANKQKMAGWECDHGLAREKELLCHVDAGLMMWDWSAVRCQFGFDFVVVKKSKNARQQARKMKNKRTSGSTIVKV